MRLFLRLEKTSDRILAILRARMEETRRAAAERQRAEAPGAGAGKADQSPVAPVRSRPQRPAFGATMGDYRPPKPAAHRGGKPAVAVGWELPYASSRQVVGENDDIHQLACGDRSEVLNVFYTDFRRPDGSGDWTWMDLTLPLPIDGDRFLWCYSQLQVDLANGAVDTSKPYVHNVICVLVGPSSLTRLDVIPQEFKDKLEGIYADPATWFTVDLYDREKNPSGGLIWLPTHRIRHYGMTDGLRCAWNHNEDWGLERAAEYWSSRVDPPGLNAHWGSPMIYRLLDMPRESRFDPNTWRDYWDLYQAENDAANAAGNRDPLTDGGPTGLTHEFVRNFVGIGQAPILSIDHDNPIYSRDLQDGTPSNTRLKWYENAPVQDPSDPEDRLTFRAWAGSDPIGHIPSTYSPATELDSEAQQPNPNWGTLYTYPYPLANHQIDKFINPGANNTVLYTVFNGVDLVYIWMTNGAAYECTVEHLIGGDTPFESYYQQNGPDAHCALIRSGSTDETDRTNPWPMFVADWGQPQENIAWLLRHGFTAEDLTLPPPPEPENAPQ